YPFSDCTKLETSWNTGLWTTFQSQTGVEVQEKHGLQVTGSTTVTQILYNEKNIINNKNCIIIQLHERITWKYELEEENRCLQRLQYVKR
ncbi:hypothetical protein STEG23_019815, partial [Scotinomys teguina]